jgi:hypothetical protein
MATFTETAAELLAKAHEAPSPVEPDTYGYFIAKSGMLCGNAEVAQRCKAHWERHVGVRYEPGADIHPSEGVSSWISSEAKLSVMVIARDLTSGQVAATRLESFGD